MGERGKQVRAAIEAVARHFAARWEERAAPPDAYIRLAGQRIALDVTVIKHTHRAGPCPRPRVRFDRVALRLMNGLHAALQEAVPEGKTVLVTVTAPIRLPAKTAAALESKIREHLAHRSALWALQDTLCGNQVRIWVTKGLAKTTPALLGFAHHPDTDPEALLRWTQSVLPTLSAAAATRRPQTHTGARWLVLTAADGRAGIEMYRYVCSQLLISADVKKIVMVWADGAVQTLRDAP